MAVPDPIEWSDALLTGIAVIDEQHKVLVGLINDANDRLAGDRGDRLLEQITRDLLAYAIYHFETEEELMKRHGYEAAAGDEAEAHLQQHRDFSKRVVALRDDLRNGRPVSREALLAFLNEWLVNHILRTDRRLGQFILARETPARG